MLRDLLRQTDEVLAARDVIVDVAPDVLVLTRFDYDLDGMALAELARVLAASGIELPHAFAPMPNTGMATAHDLDGDGRLGGARDAQGYGWFAGQGGVAVLSRWPLEGFADKSALLWKDWPGSRIATDDPGYAVQRLSHGAHVSVRVAAPTAFDVHIAAAGPPIFDGPEDRNGRRTADEVALWRSLADPSIAVQAPFVLVGLANLDPDRGEGLREVMAGLLADPVLSDPMPGQHSAAFDSAGPLRLSYVLPGRAWTVAQGRVRWPAQSGEVGHGLVWVDLVPP